MVKMAAPTSGELRSELLCYVQNSFDKCNKASLITTLSGFHEFGEIVSSGVFRILARGGLRAEGRRREGRGAVGAKGVGCGRGYVQGPVQRLYPLEVSTEEELDIVSRGQSVKPDDLCNRRQSPSAVSDSGTGTLSPHQIWTSCD